MLYRTFDIDVKVQRNPIIGHDYAKCRLKISRNIYPCVYMGETIETHMAR